MLIIHYAILHLHAATMLSYSDNKSTKVWKSATYNLALAYLAVQDVYSAISTLQTLHSLQDEEDEQYAIVALNLATVMLQSNYDTQYALELLQQLNNKHCHIANTKQQQSVGASGKQQQQQQQSHVEMKQQYRICTMITNNLGAAYEINNAPLLLEQQQETIEEEQDNEQQEKQNEILQNIQQAYNASFQFHSLSSKLQGKKMKKYPQKKSASEDDKTKQKYENYVHWNKEQFHHDVHSFYNHNNTSDDDDDDDDETEQKQLQLLSPSENTENEPPPENTPSETTLLPSPSSPKIPTQLQSAINTMTSALSTNPQQTSLWLALAKTKIIAHDKAGAVDATVQALKFAKDDDDENVRKANELLEELLHDLSSEEGEDEEEKGVVATSTASKETYKETEQQQQQQQKSKEEEESFVTQTEVQKLKLELELHSLRLQVLQQQYILGGNGPSIEMKRGDGGGYNNNKVMMVKKGEEKEEEESLSKESSTPSSTKEKEEGKETAMTQDAELEAQVKNEESGDKDNIQQEEQQVKETTDDKISSANDNDKDEDTGTSTTDHSEQEETKEGPDNETQEETKEEKGTKQVVIEIPELYNPTRQTPEEISAVARSYMKLADAYLDKQNYKLASKQFLKVLKKAPTHLPAHIGYATALERIGRSKQYCDVALAYGNATKIAILQGGGGGGGGGKSGNEGDDVRKVGNGRTSAKNQGGMAEAILRRAVTVARLSLKQEEKIQTLRVLSQYAHTYVLAADLYYFIGLEIVGEEHSMVDGGEKEKEEEEEARYAFEVANGLIHRYMTEIASANVNEGGGDDVTTSSFYHGKSMLELGKIAMSHNETVKEGVEYVGKALKSADLGDDGKVEALVLLGQAKQLSGDVSGAIQDYKSALDLPTVEKSTAKAHHQLAVALSSAGGTDDAVDKGEIEKHFEQALDLGMDPTPEAMAALGEHNISIMRSANRAQWNAYNKAMENERGGSGGGIMHGGGISSSQSVFAPQKESAEQQQQQGGQSDTLSMIEQGAVAYDGKVPTGGEGDSALGAVNRRGTTT